MPLWELPNFNQTCNVWVSPQEPATSPPSFSEVCQLYVQTKLSMMVDHTFSGFDIIQAFVRVPYNVGQFGIDYIIEVPAGYGKYLIVTYGYRTHLGFPNEYLLLAVRQCDANGNLLPWFNF